MTDANDVLRMLESLALMVQNTAEREDLDFDTYANIAELMGNMAAIARSLMGGELA